MFQPGGPRCRIRRIVSTIAVISSLALPFTGLAQTPASEAPGAPRWSTEGAATARDGYATLRWQAPAGASAVFYRMTEVHDGREQAVYLEGDQVTLFRTVPGRYEYRLAACVRAASGLPVCSDPSQPLFLDVDDGWKRALARNPVTDASTVVAAASVPGGPDQLRPGLWFNPDRDGHGYSFFWANRLALPESLATHGYAYDLLGFWYTYEAKTVALANPDDCVDGAEAGCDLVFGDYRPLAARLRLVQDGASRYSGGIFITRDGREVLQGSVSITFGAANDSAVIDWAVDFRHQRHAAAESIVPLTGMDPDDFANATHYSGIWQPVDGSPIRLVSSIGSQSEAVELIFEDATGDPAWIQAVNEGPASPFPSSLCFRYVRSGYAPDATGGVQFADVGCAGGLPASETNRNAVRGFTGFETARAWAELVLPDGRGEVRLGTPEVPADLYKTASFHRIGFELQASGCVLTITVADCTVAVSWFTDGDYPDATAFLHHIDSGKRTPLAAPAGVAVLDFPFTLDTPGLYRFELRMTNASGSTLIASSPVLNAEFSFVLPPFDLAARWLDAGARRVGLSWSHDDPEGVDRYQVEERAPGSTEVVVHEVSPGSLRELAFAYPDGPWGEFAYRVRACIDEVYGPECSAWTDPVAWQVDAIAPQDGVAHPWGDHAVGSEPLFVGVAMDYAMGYHFRPDVDGRVTQLGGLFDGVKTVRLFDRASRALLAEARVAGTNDWRYAAIEPVAVESGREYTVAVYLENDGGSYYAEPVLPVRNDDVTILGSTYVSTAGEPDAIPVNRVLEPMYGQADIGFVADAPKDGTTVPANPETPPAPAPRPDFTIDPESASVGATQGVFDVDAHGAATYRIPLTTAPGAGGLAPELALQYNSQAPNDVAGVGWSIAGLSAITRCPQTFEQDGVAPARGVALDREDRFCLDGQRLMVVAGTYGVDGAEYRTEIDGFQRIRSFGAAGSGPAWFRVWHGDGSFSDYGATDDARIVARSGAHAGTALSWAISRHEDGSGNFIEYRYDQASDGPVEAVLERVRYTGNRRAGTAPYAELRFAYTDGRGDVPLSWLRGVAVARDRLLVRVDSLARVRATDRSMVPLRSLFLDYGQDGFGRRVLASVTECSDPDRDVCFAPTRFEWLKNEHTIRGVDGYPVGALFERDFRGLNIADVNGDGFNDLLIVEGRKTFTFSVAFADEHGRFRRDAAAYPLPGNGEKREPVQMLVIDLDADGRQDVVYPRQTGDRIDWVARLAGPNGFGAERIVAQGCCERRDPRVARIVDFNGDGLADLLTDRGAGAQSGQGDLVVLLNALEPGGAPGFAPPRPIRVVYDADLFPQDPVGEWALLDDAPGFAEVTARTPNAVQAFDFNGDGAVDLLARIDRRYVRCDTSCNTNAATVSAASDGQQFDFDGSTEARGNEAYETVGFYIVFESDGLDRYVQRHVVATDAESGCTVSVACEPWAQLPAVHQLQAVDINGDGLADLAWRDSRNDWWFRVNTGAGFAAPRVIVRLPERDQSALGRFADLGGDGFPEFLYPSATDRRDATWIVHTNDLGAGYGAAEPSDVLLGNHAGGDISLLYDFNGDGATDNLLLDFRNGVVDSGRSALYPGVNRFGGSSHQAPNVLQGIRDGAGRMTRLHYRPMTDPVTYTRRHDAVSVRWGRGSPVFDLLAPLWLVAAVDHSAPTWSEPEALDTTLYHYAGARVQAGRGFLGFAETVRWRPQAGLRINTRYRQDFPFVGVVADVTRSLVPAANGLDLLGASRDWPPIDERTAPPVLEDGARLIGHAAHDWRADANDFGAWHRRTVSILERSWSPEGELLEKTLATHEHDAFGRISRSSERTWAAEQAEPLLTVTTRNTHLSEQDARWMLHRLANVVVEHRRPGQPTVTRASAFAYDPETGRRVREVTEPGDAALEVVTTYRLDAFGNPVETTVAARDVPPRVSRMAYDSLGRFAVREINAYGQVRMQVHEWNAAGTPLTVADIDGVLTYSAVDPMGRVFANWTETGRWDRTVRRHGAGPVCPAGTAHHLHTVSGGEPDRYDCFDSLGRVIRSARPGFDGRLVFEDTAYDGQGRRERVSEPYFQGDARYWNRTVYDAIGRTVALESAAGDDFERDHGSAAVHCGVAGAHGARTVNSAGQARLELRNVLGELVGVIDSLCGRTDYRYDAVGNLVEVTGIDGTSVRMRYDGAGRRIAMDDPDKGHWQYAWNGLGELVRQRDAKGQALDYRYDDLGRVIQRLELRGVDFLADTSFTVVNTERTVWQNSSTENVYGKGQPLSVTYREGVAGAVLHQRQYRYDEFGRQAEVLSDIGDRHFSEATTWDRYGRIFQQFDASGDARGVRHVYNAHGYLEALREAREGAEGRVYSTILSMSERGRITAWRLGNGVEAFADFEPASGKLLKLTAYDATGRELQELDYGFDSLGNLARRADRSNGRERVEFFSYDDLSRLVEVRYEAPDAPASPDTLRIAYDAAGNVTWKSDVGTYRYGAGAGPHAVTSAGSAEYRYDANGNQVAGGGRTLEYSVFDKALRITSGGMETRFEYGIAHQRIRRVDRNDIDGDRTTWHLDTADLVETPAGAWFKRRIADVAVIDHHPENDVSEVRYLLRDHAGSVHTVTNASGMLESAVWMSFDAFGQRRTSDWAGPPGLGALLTLNSLTTRGYTGHEHVDALGLVDMGGRLYDPRLGRFLQADPLVQQPSDGQNLNRYSYAANNPMSHTDPTGYSFKRLIKRWGRLLAAVVLSVVLPGSGGILATGFGIGNVYAQAAITGFVAGAVASGTFKGAVIGALVSLAVTGVIEAYSAAQQGAGLASADDLMPPEDDIRHLYGKNEPPAGLYRIEVAADGTFFDASKISSSGLASDDVIFTNGMNNGFRAAVRNGTVHLHQAGLLSNRYILNFNPTRGFVSDILEASRDIVGAHTGLTHTSLARSLADALHTASLRGVTGVQLVGHSQGGAITASALRYAGKAGLSLRSLAGGGVALHGAPINAWMARNRLLDQAGANVVSRAQFGDAVHVLGGLNVANPLEVLISIYRTPALFSPDTSVSPHAMPCGGRASLVCAW